MKLQTIIGSLILLACFGCGNSDRQETADTIVSLTTNSTEVVKVEPFVPLPANVEYSVQFKDLCSANPEVLVSGQEKKQRGICLPYNYEKKDSKDSLILSYEFIDDCCMPYRGDAYQSGDILYLGLHLPRVDSVTRCDCWCKYKMTYRVKKDSTEWSSIVVVKGYASTKKYLSTFGSEFKLIEK